MKKPTDEHERTATLEPPSEVIRLPLWKSCLDDMRAEGIHYGKVYEAEHLETRLRTTRDTLEFGIAISEIRRELEKDGFYLSGRGQKGAQLVILQPEANADVMQSYQRKALDAMRRGVILGTNTRLDTLGDTERKHHEAVLERMAMKTVLMSRTTQIANVIRQHKPALLDTPKRDDEPPAAAAAVNAKPPKPTAPAAAKRK